MWREIWIQVYFLHVDIHCSSPFIEKTVLSPVNSVNCLSIFVKKSTGHIRMSLFLDSILFYHSVCLPSLQNHTVLTTTALC